MCLSSPRWPLRLCPWYRLMSTYARDSCFLSLACPQVDCRVEGCARLVFSRLLPNQPAKWADQCPCSPTLFLHACPSFTSYIVLLLLIKYVYFVFLQLKFIIAWMSRYSRFQDISIFSLWSFSVSFFPPFFMLFCKICKFRALFLPAFIFHNIVSPLATCILTCIISFVVWKLLLLISNC